LLFYFDNRLCELTKLDRTSYLIRILSSLVFSPYGASYWGLPGFPNYIRHFPFSELHSDHLRICSFDPPRLLFPFKSCVLSLFLAELTETLSARLVPAYRTPSLFSGEEPFLFHFPRCQTSISLVLCPCFAFSCFPVSTFLVDALLVFFCPVHNSFTE